MPLDWKQDAPYEDLFSLDARIQVSMDLLDLVNPYEALLEASART